MRFKHLGSQFGILRKDDSCLLAVEEKLKGRRGLDFQYWRVGFMLDSRRKMVHGRAAS